MPRIWVSALFIMGIIVFFAILIPANLTGEQSENGYISKREDFWYGLVSEVNIRKNLVVWKLSIDGHPLKKIEEKPINKKALNEFHKLTGQVLASQKKAIVHAIGLLTVLFVFTFHRKRFFPDRKQRKMKLFFISLFVVYGLSMSIWKIYQASSLNIKAEELFHFMIRE